MKEFQSLQILRESLGRVWTAEQHWKDLQLPFIFTENNLFCIHGIIVWNSHPFGHSSWIFISYLTENYNTVPLPVTLNSAVHWSRLRLGWCGLRWEDVPPTIVPSGETAEIAPTLHRIEYLCWSMKLFNYLGPLTERQLRLLGLFQW